MTGLSMPERAAAPRASCRELESLKVIAVGMLGSIIPAHDLP
jgi:hypothetical protein